MLFFAESTLVVLNLFFAIFGVITGGSSWLIALNAFSGGFLLAGTLERLVRGEYE